MEINKLREFQLDFEKNKKSIHSDFKKISKLREIFTKDYTTKIISSLNIDDFVIGKGKPTFCNRIENELNGWGNMHGSPAKKFGIYYGVSGKDKEREYRIGKASFGATIDEAFNSVVACIIELIENEDDYELLKRNFISPMFKGKILSIYHPKKFLNIFSAAHLNYFINMLALENSSKSELDKQKILLDFKNNDSVMNRWSIFEYSEFLYYTFGRPNNEVKDNDLSIELDGYKLKDFPPIEDINIKFVDLKTDEFPKSGGKKNKKSKKNNYSEQSKRFKIIGDRGEQIVVVAERQYLIDNGRADLSKKVDQISKRDDTVGYDIQSYDKDGNEKYIEVKSTLRPVGLINIYISGNELLIAENKNNYYFYIVYDVGDTTPSIWKIKGTDFLSDSNIEKKPILYKIKLKAI